MAFYKIKSVSAMKPTTFLIVSFSFGLVSGRPVTSAEDVGLTTVAANTVSHSTATGTIETTAAATQPASINLPNPLSKRGKPQMKWLNDETTNVFKVTDSRARRGQNIIFVERHACRIFEKAGCNAGNMKMVRPEADGPIHAELGFDHPHHGSSKARLELNGKGTLLPPDIRKDPMASMKYWAWRAGTRVKNLGRKPKPWYQGD